MVDPAGQLKKELSDDGLNPNAMGYRVMSSAALEVIGRAVPLQAEEPQDNQLNKRRLKPLTK